MQAEIITVGDELLIGQIVDTNSQWIGEYLNKIGIAVYQISSVQDSSEHILNALEEAASRVDLVIMTGGLGPTKDDITKKTLLTFFEDSFVFNQEISDHIEAMFKRVNYPFTEVNRNQALVPSSCIPFLNHYGTAPGMWFEKNNTIFVSLPGVPVEMKGLMTKSVLPKLQKEFQLPFILHRTVMTYGMGESMVAERLSDWEDQLPASIKLAYLPSFGKLRLRLTAKGSNKDVLLQKLQIEIEKLHELISDIIVGYDEDESLEVVLGRMLNERNATLAVAESCTGGFISQIITSVAGASRYFRGSIIAYSEAVKMKQLGVSKATIDAYSIVSTQVAAEMAVAVREKLNTDFSIATTGNAGPTTDKTDKTVGVVCIAIASKNGIWSEEFSFGKPRKKVIERAGFKALEMLKKEILKND